MSRSSALRAAAVALTVSSALFLAGCAKSVVGKWSATDPRIGQVTTEFKSDGTFSQTGNIPLVGSIDATGTYKTEKDTFSMTTTDIKAGGQSIMNKIPPQFKSALDRNGTFKVDGDKLEITAGGQTQTMTRVKE
jgi:hypothetical protein